MKMTTKMLAVAMVAVMAFAALVVVSDASEDDGAVTNQYATNNSYEVVINTTQVTDGAGISTVPTATNQYSFAVAGTLAFEATKDNWPMTVKIYNTKWTASSISNILVNGEPKILYGPETTASGTANVYFVIVDLDISWNEADNIFSLQIVDNTHPDAVDYFTLDLTGLVMEKYQVNGTKYTTLEAALAAAGTTYPVEVLKTFTKSYNYGKNVEFGNGFVLTAAGYDIEVLDKIDDTHVSSKTLVDVMPASTQPYVYYKATSTAFVTSYIYQPWNLSPIAIKSIECVKNSVEYNGTAQVPELKVTDVNGVVVSGYTPMYDTGSGTPVVTAPVNVNIVGGKVAPYAVTIKADNFTNFDVEGINCLFTITPYDLSVPGRVALEGDNGLVYDGTNKTVTIKFDQMTAYLFSLTGNQLTAASIMGECEQVNADGKTTTKYADNVNITALTVTGKVAGTHVIKMAVGTNFTSGIVGQANVNFQWVIAQGVITDDKYTLEWMTKGVEISTSDDTKVLLIGSPALVLGVDYKIKYVSVDRERAVDELDDDTFGSWRAMAIGIVNYSGVVFTVEFKIVQGNFPVYELTGISFTEQGNSMIIGFSDPIMDMIDDAELIVTYNTVILKDGVYQNSLISQIKVPVQDGVRAQYVTLDGIYSYAHVVLKYTVGNETAPMTVWSQPLVYEADAKSWATSEVKIVDANYKVIDGAALIIDDMVIPNGNAILGGLQNVTKLAVSYMGKEFAVSNYEIVNGQVLFDGKVFKVNDIKAPTSALNVSVPNGNKTVGEVVKITVVDGKEGDLISNFSLVPSTETPAHPAYDLTATAGGKDVKAFVKVDPRNWTVTSSVACHVNVVFYFLNATKTIDLDFGNGGTALNMDLTTGVSGATVTANGLISGAGTTAFEGEIVVLSLKVGTKTLNHVILKDALGNNIDLKAGTVSGTGSDTTYNYSFVMPASNVTLLVNAA